MPVLITLAGIILFFVILFSIHVSFTVDYGEKTVVILKYLFLKFTLVDTSKPPKPKKEKKKKDDKKSDDKDKDVEKTKDKKPSNGNSLIKQLYRDQGYDGLVKMLKAIGDSLSGFFGKLYKTFVIDELYITMITAGGDAADTAIKHGKLCAWLFPVLGKLVSGCKVKKYDFDITPDFLASKSEAQAYVRFRVTPIRITNALVVMALQLVFKVLLKILFAKNKQEKNAKNKKAKTDVDTKTATDDNKTNAIKSNKDGASS